MNHTGRYESGSIAGMSCNLSLLVIAICFSALPTRAVFQSSGITSAEILRLGVGARVPALGGIMPAGAIGVDAGWYNPAGLARMEGREIAGGYQALVEKINQGNIGYAGRLNERIGISIFVSYLDYGHLDRTTVSTNGAFTSVNRAGTFDAQDLAGGVALGRRFTKWSSAGVAFKFVNSRIDNASATALAADIGAEWILSHEIPVTFGAVVKNIGTGLKYDRVREDLPLSYQLGLHAEFLDRRVALFAAGEKVNQDNLVFRGGLELRPFGSVLAIRAGYDGTHDVDNGLTAGIGVAIREFTFDYAYIPFGKFGDNHRVGLTARF